MTLLEDRVRLLEEQMLDLTLRVWALEGLPPPEPEIPIIPARSLAVDVSAWQGMFDWDRAAIHGVKYAIIRSSNGTLEFATGTENEEGRDKWLIHNAYELTRQHIPFSIYHLMQPGNATEQAQLVNDILGELAGRGTPPVPVKLENGRVLPVVWCDIEVAGITPADIKAFYDETYCGIYSRYGLWNPLMNTADNWWTDVACWMAQYGANSGQIPAEGAKPTRPLGFRDVDVWQFTSQGAALIGISGDVGLDMNLVGPWVTETEPPPEPPPPPPPPPVTTYDIGLYLSPPAGRDMGDIVMLQTSWDGQQRVQLQRDGDTVYTVKGHEYEQRTIGPNTIDLTLDTSPGERPAPSGQKYKAIYTATGPWCGRHMAIGDVVQQAGILTYKRYDNCQVMETAGRFGEERLIAHYDAMTLDGGLKFNDIVLLEWWIFDKALGMKRWEERYYAAAGVGLIQWENYAGLKSWAVEWIPLGSQENNLRERGCWG